MDIFSYIKPKSKAVAENDYEKGKVYAFKSMIDIYILFGKNFDQTRQSIYFFSYLKNMSKMQSEKEEDFYKGQVDAYEETFEHFRPKRKKQ